MAELRNFPGDTLLHRLDPRNKFFLLLLYIFVEVAFTDIRVLVLPFVASIILYLSAKIPFKEVKSSWKFLLTIIVVISTVNALFTLLGASVAHPHIIARLWVLTLTEEGAFFALAALMRFLSLAVIAMSVFLTTDPTLYAPALAKLKVPYKGAFVVDLALRYLPTYASELDTTLNAQMARGYKARAKGGLRARILNTIPLLVPVALGAMLSIYDVADAMELRAFGAKGRRTWYRELRARGVDYAAFVVIALMLAVAIYLRTRITTYWIPT
jgi:energy-coupling factor transport system permease protein